MSNKIVSQRIFPKICSMSPCDDYASMTQDNFKKDFSNIPIVKANSPLQEEQNFVVSFVMADDIMIDVK